MPKVIVTLRRCYSKLVFAKMLPLWRIFAGLLLLAICRGNKVYDYPLDDDYDYYGDSKDSHDDADYDTSEYTKEAALDGLQEAKILTQPKHLIVDSGTTIQLPCLVDKLPDQVQIMWKRPDAETNQILVIGKTIQDEDYKTRTEVEIKKDGSFLNIGVANVGDAGRYTCELAIPGIKQRSVTHTVSIRVPPEISQHSDSVVQTKKGRQVRLACKGTGHPEPTVKWTRVGKGKLPDGSSEKEGEELMISNVDRHDAGVYRCTADNGFTQQASKEIELKVMYTPEIQVQEVFVHTKTGKDVEIVCNVHGEPKPSVSWKKDGQPVKQDSRLKLTNIHSKHSLIISQVERSDFGEYSCHAASSTGSEQQHIEISGMAGPPEFKSEPAGGQADSYLLEWTVVSYTLVTAFKVEIREVGTTAWRESSAKPIEDGPYHYAGKEFLKELTYATRYEARVQARNDEGWSKTREHFYFATQGAEPPVKGVTAGSSAGLGGLATSCLLTIVLLVHALC